MLPRFFYHPLLHTAVGTFVAVQLGYWSCAYLEKRRQDASWERIEKKLEKLEELTLRREAECIRLDEEEQK
jgi:membrane protein DedA with SNARE-associated domain